MKTYIDNFEDWKGKTISSLIPDCDTEPSEIIIFFDDDTVTKIHASTNYDRCGDYDGSVIKVESGKYFSNSEKHIMGLITDDEYKIFEKDRLDKKKKQEEEERKAKQRLEEIAKTKRREEYERLKKEFEGEK